MIVDDEPMIRKGLHTIIDWESFGFAVAGEAANGQEAMEKHAGLKPDLILMDIRMPGMDGIETIEAIRRADKECHILILSGYADFTYAKQAIAFGVDGYILKPVDETELEEYAERIADALNRKSANKALPQADERIEKVLEEAVRGFGSDRQREKDIEQLSVALGRPAEGFRLVLIEWSRSAELPIALFAAARRRLRDIVNEADAGWVFAAEPYTALLAKGGSPADSEDRLLDWIRQAAGQNGKFIALAGERFESGGELAACFGRLQQPMKASFRLREGCLHTLQDVVKVTAGMPGNQPLPSVEELSHWLYDAVDTGNEEAIPKALREIGGRLWNHSASEQTVKTAFAQLLALLINRLAANYSELNMQEELTAVTELYKQTNYDAMLDGLAERLVDLIGRIGNSSSVPIMKRITAYIERHYNQNLKLETIAERFNYNSGYLGKMFKAHIGEHFNTYLDQVRLRHAVELLQQGYKVHQVSEMVGYANVDYFHAKFKKYKGVSPSYYKTGGTKN
jgi:two-component system response regulator YesN